MKSNSPSPPAPLPLAGEGMRAPASGEREAVPVLEGWFTLDRDKPQLIGSRCTACGTYYFPRQGHFCRNPDCAGETFEAVLLSRTGTLWSYTSASYQPPPPYVANEPFQPFGIAAVELAQEKMIVLGQLASGVDLATLKVGQAMELVLEPLDDGKLTWKWRPALSPNPSPTSGRGEKDALSTNPSPASGRGWPEGPGEGSPKGREKGG
jgi:uncharacterized protein